MLNQRTTIMLIVIFILLVGVYYALDQTEHSLHPPLPTPTTHPLVFPGIAPSQITRLEVDDVQGGRKIILVKQPGGWLATNESGLTVNAKSKEISDMIQNLPTLRYNRVMEGSDVQAFGFAGGGFMVVKFDAGASYLLRVGDLNSDQSYAYVQRGTDPAVLQVPYKPLSLIIAAIIDPDLVVTAAATSAP